MTYVYFVGPLKVYYQVPDSFSSPLNQWSMYFFFFFFSIELYSYNFPLKIGWYQLVFEGDTNKLVPGHFQMVAPTPRRDLADLKYQFPLWHHKGIISEPVNFSTDYLKCKGSQRKDFCLF